MPDIICVKFGENILLFEDVRDDGPRAACLVGTVISVSKARAVVWRGISLSYVTEHTALFEG